MHEPELSEYRRAVNEELWSELHRFREVMTQWGRVLVARGDLSVEQFCEAWYGSPTAMRCSFHVPIPETLLHELRELEAPHRRLFIG